MAYSSLLFIYIFLPVSLIAFYAVPKKYREAVLLVLSMLYCAANSIYMLIFMLIFTLLNFTMSRITEFLREQKSIAEVALVSTVVIDITVIFGFRAPYMNWFSGMIRAPEGFFPLGISLYALSAIGTLIDVYKGKEKAEKNILRFALYIMFFPRLIIGPVMRYRTFRKMMKGESKGLEDIGTGLLIFIKGLAKKVLAADTLFTLYTAVKCTESHRMPLVTAWIGAAAYLLCLYFELSGFADMGAGVARCFGIVFPKCFNYPVFSTRVRLFAERWNTHAVLWFKRYISKPLRVQGKSKAAKIGAFLLAWALLGFWYNFNINGIVGGIFLGTVILAENRFRNRNTLKITGRIYTFVVAAIFAAFMSCGSVGLSLKYIASMLGAGGFADSQSWYFIRSYAVILAVCAFSASDLGRRILSAASKNKYTKPVFAAVPVAAVIALSLCTAFLADKGFSEMLLIRL